MHQFLNRVESRVTDTNIDGYSNQTSAQGHDAAPCMVMIRPCIKQRRHAMEVAVVISRLRPGTYTTRNQSLSDKTTVNHSPTHTCANASAGAPSSTRDSEVIRSKSFACSQSAWCSAHPSREFSRDPHQEQPGANAPGTRTSPSAILADADRGVSDSKKATWAQTNRHTREIGDLRAE